MAALPFFPPPHDYKSLEGAPIIAIQIIESKPRIRFQPEHETGRVILGVMFGCTISSHGPDSS